MGQATSLGLGEIALQKNIYVLAACLVVREGGKTKARNNYHTDYAEYDTDKSFDHVEEVLFTRLGSATSGFTTIPNGSRVVFCCNWSPCPDCVDYKARTHVKALLAATPRDVVVRFVYTNVWAEDFGLKKTYKTMFKTTKAAREAYAAMEEDLNTLYPGYVKHFHEEMNLESDSCLYPRFGIRQVTG